MLIILLHAGSGKISLVDHTAYHCMLDWRIGALENCHWFAIIPLHDHYTGVNLQMCLQVVCRGVVEAYQAVGSIHAFGPHLLRLTHAMLQCEFTIVLLSLCTFIVTDDP